MMKTDRLHARKELRHKTIQHEVEKKLSATYWKRLLPQQMTKTRWELTNDFGALGQQGSPPLKHQGNLITNAAG